MFTIATYRFYIHSISLLKTNIGYIMLYNVIYSYNGNWKARAWHGRTAR